MDSPFVFEDDFFDDKQCEVVKQTTKDVRLREIQSGWFNTPPCIVDGSDEMTRLKFCGDWAYRQGQYSKALTHFKDCLVLLSNSNTTLRRELLESLTRCKAYLNEEEEAIRGYRTLRESSTNFEQTSVSLQLGVFVFRMFHCTNELFQTLQELVILHPSDATVWLELAEVYGTLLNEKCVGKDCMSTLLKYVASLYRTRFLLEQTCRSSYSFVNQTHQENLLKVTEKTGSCDLPAEIKDRICEHMCKYQALEDHHGDDRIVVSLLSKSEEVFHSYWLPWLDSCLVTLTTSRKDEVMSQSHVKRDIT